MAVKILIFENNPEDFENINRAITRKFGDKISIFPDINAKTKNITHFDFFLEKYAQPAKFQDIVDYYKDIDLFILDVHLVNNRDFTGRRFYAFLRNIPYRDGDFKTIEVSNGNSDTKDSNIIYISKVDDRMYTNRIIDAIVDLYPTLLSNDNINTSTDKARHPLFEHGPWDALDKTGKKIDIGIRWGIHTIICLCFYFLIILTIGVGTIKITNGLGYNIPIPFAKVDNPLADSLTSTAIIENTAAKSDSTTNNLSSKEKKKYKIEDMEVFKTAEDIFLYLLPIFITFGFYNYYKTNMRVYLLGGKKEDINEAQSISSMNLSKMIFISSIISYVLVKSTEAVFYGDCDNMGRLVAAGVLLLILMSYFVIMYKKEHGGH